jgi:hypothetical protein
MIQAIIRAVIFVALLTLAFYFLLADGINRRQGVYYDCSMASFHPDIPPAAKEACRTRKPTQ